MEKTSLTGRALGVQDFALGVEHDIEFLGALDNFDVVELTVGGTFDGFDIADALRAVAHFDGCFDIGWKLEDSIARIAKLVSQFI